MRNYNKTAAIVIIIHNYDIAERMQRTVYTRTLPPGR